MALILRFDYSPHAHVAERFVCPFALTPNVLSSQKEKTSMGKCNKWWEGSQLRYIKVDRIAVSSWWGTLRSFDFLISGTIRTFTCFILLAWLVQYVHCADSLARRPLWHMLTAVPLRAFAPRRLPFKAQRHCPMASVHVVDIHLFFFDGFCWGLSTILRSYTFVDKKILLEQGQV